jgi:uncharacterized protein (TIGR02001 family)
MHSLINSFLLISLFFLTHYIAADADASTLTNSNEVAGGKVTGKMTFASDYVFRGESETADGEIPAIQANLTWTHESNVYVGLFGSTNKFVTAPDIYAVVGPYIGNYGSIDSWGIEYNAFWFVYLYPGATQFNYSELWMQASKSFDDLTFGVEITPTTQDWFGVDGWQGVNYATSLSWQLNTRINFSATLGHQQLDGDGAEGWNHGNIGVEYQAFSLVFDLRYHNTDIDENHKVYGSPEGLAIFDSRVVWSVSKSF